MIDTDKYEGHTVGDMTFSQAGEKLWFLGHPHIHRASDCMTMNKATLDLILDAPLLLAEVIQLSKIIDFAWEVMDDQTAVEFNDLIIELNGEAEQRWEEE